MQKFTRRLFVASALALSVASAGAAKAEDMILASVPGQIGRASCRERV